VEGPSVGGRATGACLAPLPEGLDLLLVEGRQGDELADRRAQVVGGQVGPGRVPAALPRAARLPLLREGPEEGALDHLLDLGARPVLEIARELDDRVGAVVAAAS